MARTTEEIISGNIGSLKELREEIKRLKDELVTTKEGTQEWADRTGQLYAAQKRLDDINKAAKGTLNEQLSMQKNSINQLKQLIKQKNLERNAMDMSSDSYAKATEELKELNDKLRESGTSAGDWRANVGNYADSIKSAFGEMGTAATGLAGNMGMLNASMLKLAANPVGAVITAIVLVLKGLAEGIKSSEANTVAFNKALAPLKATGTEILKLFQKLAGWVIDIAVNFQKAAKESGVLDKAIDILSVPIALIVKQFERMGNGLKLVWEWMGKLVGPIMKAGQAIADWIEKPMNRVIGLYNKLAKTKVGEFLGLPTVEDVRKVRKTMKVAVDAIDETASKISDLDELEYQINKNRRKRNEENARDNVRMAELDLIAAEAKEAKDYAKALDALNQRKEIQKRIDEREVATAREEYDLLRRRNALADSNTEDLDAESDAKVKLTEATARLNQNQANLTRQMIEIQNLQRASGTADETARTKAFAEAVKNLNNELKAFDLDYSKAMDKVKANEPEGPEGKDIDKQSIDAYYDQMSAMYQAEYDAYASMTDGKIAKLEEFTEAQKALGNSVEEQEQKIAELRYKKDKEYNSMIAKQQKAEKDRAKAQKTNFNATLSAYGSMMDGMSELFEENTTAYKATATAKALIDTFLAANAVLAEQQGGLVARIAAMAGVIASGIANVVSIWKVNTSGENSTSVSTGSAITTPRIAETTPYQLTRNVQTEQEQAQSEQPVWVSVKDIETGLSTVKVRDDESTF